MAMGEQFQRLLPSSFFPSAPTVEEPARKYSRAQNFHACNQFLLNLSRMEEKFSSSARPECV